MRYNAVRYACFTLIALICLSVASGCGGGRGNGVIGAEIDPAAGAGDPLAAAPVLPADEYIDPAEIIARRGSELASRTLTGAEASGASGNTTVTDDSMQFAPGGAAIGAWAMYGFPDLVDSDFPLRLEFAFDVDAGLPDECYLGLSNYTAVCWDWTVVAVPTGSDSLQIPTDIDAVSPGGNLYAVVMVRGEATAVLDTVTLHLDSHYLPAPDGLVATEGTLDGMIRLTWDDPAVTYPELEYTGVMIERAPDPAGPWDELAVVDAAETGYDDAIDDAQGIDPLVPVYYRLRTVLNEIHGAPGLAVSGWLAVPAVGYLMASDDLPDRIEITWEPVPAADSYLLEYRRTVSLTEPWVSLIEVDALEGPAFIHTPDNPPGQSLYAYSYYYRVKAVAGEYSSLDWSPGDGGTSHASNDFSATDGDGPEQIGLSWYGRSDRDSFVIKYRNSEGGFPTEWTVLMEVPYEWSNLQYHNTTEPAGCEAEHGVVYEYRLYGMCGGEIADDILGEDTGYCAIGDVPVLTATQNDAERICIAWEAVPGAESYQLEYRNLNGGTPVDWTPLTEAGPADTAFDHTETAPAGLVAQPDTFYEYRIRAGWSGACSLNWTNGATGCLRFGNVTGFSATDGFYPDYTALDWEQLPQADAYEVEYRDLDGGTPADWTALVEISDVATTTFNHTTTEPVGRECIPLERYEYRIRGRLGAVYSPEWAADTGSCGAGPGDWCMEGRDAKQQRRSPHIGPDTPELLWSYELEDYHSYSCSPVSQGADGTVYFCERWGPLYALNHLDGTVKWINDEFQCGYSVVPAIDADGTIYVSGLNGAGDLGEGFYLHACNPDGSIKWMDCAGSYTMPYLVTASPVISALDTIIWSRSPFSIPFEGRLHATGRDGASRWAYTGSCGVLRTPAISDTGLVYATCSDYVGDTGTWSPTFNLHAINPDGTQAWSAPETGQGFSPSIGDDGRIHVCLGQYDDCDLYCYEPDGTLAWSLYLPCSGWSGLAIGADGCIYTGFLDNSDRDYLRLYAVNPAGTIRWVYEIPYVSGLLTDGAPAIDGAGTIYAGGPDGLHAINPDGTLKWLYETDRAVSLSPTIGNDGTIFFPTDGIVHAVGPGIS